MQMFKLLLHCNSYIQEDTNKIRFRKGYDVKERGKDTLVFR